MLALLARLDPAAAFREEVLYCIQHHYAHRAYCANLGHSTHFLPMPVTMAAQGSMTLHPLVTAMSPAKMPLHTASVSHTPVDTKR